MFSVVITNRSMNDFVTSNSAEMEFSTLEECKDYIKSSEHYHPNRFFYRITENGKPWRMTELDASTSSRIA